MKVICMLCDKEEYLDATSFLAKQYQNHPLKTYLCEECKTRIAIKTINRRKKAAVEQEKE